MVEIDGEIWGISLSRSSKICGPRFMFRFPADCCGWDIRGMADLVSRTIRSTKIGGMGQPLPRGAGASTRGP
jgi:hypothetical protein